MAVCGRTRESISERRVVTTEKSRASRRRAKTPVPRSPWSRPGFVVTDSADSGEEVDVTHDFGVDDGWDFVYGDFVALAVEADLVGADENVNSGAGLFRDRGSAQRGGAVWREIDVKLCVHVPVVEIPCWERWRHRNPNPSAGSSSRGLCRGGELVLPK